jgi:plasmid segregation protein ParM
MEAFMTNKKDDGQIRFVAVDDGYAQTKLVGECPETGDLKRAILRSAIRPGRSGLSSFGGGGISLYTTEEGDHFTVSADVESENLQFDGFHTSQLNRVLVNHALISAGYGGKDVNLVTGLPVADYFIDDERDQDQIEAKRRNLMKGVTSADRELMPRITDVRVGCQAVAAWFDHVLDDQLEQRNDPSGRIAIVDIGGRTTDIAVVIGGNAIDHAVSGTENLGVLDVYNSVSKAIRREYRIKERFPIDQLDAAVRTGQFRLWNKQHDVSELVESAVQEHENRIAREVERRLGSAANLNSVVFVGGGSALFQSIAGHFPNGVMSDHPEFANASGLYKYLRLKS